MEQQRAINALEPFLALSKTATSPRAAADLITKATSAPNTYVFAELLHTPSIAGLRDSPEFGSYYKLLEIFAWGTWADYKSTSGLPELSPPQHQKLLLLSLLPLAKQQSNLSYQNLQQALSIPDQKSLESLITTAIYASLITGTLDPHHQLVNITSVASLRDLPPASIPSLIQTLQQWSSQCSNTLSSLEAQIESVKARAKTEGERKNTVKKIIDEKIAKEEEKKEKKYGSGKDAGDDEYDPMEVDTGGSGRQTRSSKKGFWASAVGR